LQRHAFATDRRRLGEEAGNILASEPSVTSGADAKSLQPAVVAPAADRVDVDAQQSGDIPCRQEGGNLAAIFRST
jgi:hypothetical protein